MRTYTKPKTFSLWCCLLALFEIDEVRNKNKTGSMAKNVKFAGCIAVIQNQLTILHFWKTMPKLRLSLLSSRRFQLHSKQKEAEKSNSPDLII